MRSDPVASLKRQQSHTITNSAKNKLLQSLMEKSELIRGKAFVFIIPSFPDPRKLIKACYVLFWILADTTLDLCVPEWVSFVCLCFGGSWVLSAQCSLPDHVPHHALVCTPDEPPTSSPGPAATTAKLRLPRGGRETLLTRPNPNNSTISVPDAHQHWSKSSIFTEQLLKSLRQQ